ncbi:MAG: polysaccharide biosynthesis tyrosine autokinase [Pedobacter sp.]|nr:polysaccharide biosynthesis tyrosine autokinase [Pedobacter sp.]
MNYNLRSSPISYYKLLKVVISRWYWLLIALSCGLVSCYLFLIFTPKEYKSSASLKYEDKKSEISELLSVRNLYDRTNKVESEKSIILSRKVLSAAIMALDYQVIFFEKVNFSLVAIYPRKPINIVFLKKNTSATVKHRFRYRQVDKRQFELCLKSEKIDFCKIYNYNQPISVLEFVITINDHLWNEASSPVFFKIADPNELIETIQRGVKIDDSQNTNILKIKYISTNSAFCADILNAILDEYLKFDVKQKENTLAQTSKFLNLLLAEISSKVEISGSALQSFKETNNLSNINSLAAENHLILEKIGTEKHILDVDSKVLRFVSSRITENPLKGISTYNLQGLTDPQLQGLVEKYQQLNLTLREKLKVYTSDSEPIQFLDSQIKDLQSSIVKSLSEHLNLNLQRTIFLVRLADSIKTVLKTIPKIENAANSLASSFGLDQKVQEFLAHKKLETQIVNAAITPIATILDRASYPIEPIGPITLSCYLVTTMFSILGGTLVIITIHLYNPFIYTKEHIEELTAIPILGVVNKSYNQPQSRDNQIVLQDFPRTSFGESIRFIRSNLNFIAPDKGKVICITSAVSGEGKSFLSINLAYSLTLIQKRVIIIAGDLRKSTLHASFNLPNSNGLSKYLSGQTDLKSICAKTNISDLDIITAGPTPPNPSELLQSHMMNYLIKELRLFYDVILIDSAPIGLVSDIKPVMILADVNLFIVRCGVSKPSYTQTAERLKEELNLASVAIILNDFKSDNFHNHYYKDSR